MHRLCTIAELLHEMLSYVDKTDSARAARVCKAWTEVAMDIVWETANFKIFRGLDMTLVEEQGSMYFLVR